MLRSKTLVALALAIASPVVIGATVEQWRQRTPRWQATTKRSFTELQGCLGTRWVGTLSAKMQAMPIERGMSYTNSGSNRDILVDVTDDGDHRTVKLWLRSFVGITAGAKEQIEKLSACTNPSPPAA